MVVTDGAAVYQKPDFDSKVVTYLNFKTQILASTKPVTGSTGLGLFHRIAHKEVQGFIADTDIRLLSAVKELVPSKDKEKGGKSKAWEQEERDSMGESPLYLTRYLGGALAMVNFTEKFQGRKLSDNMTMYGMRMTGPGTLFDGPPIDFNFWFTLSKPGYYSKFSSGAPTGFMLFGDVMAMFPMIDTQRTIVNFGLGIMYTYTRYKIPVKEITIDSQELRVGLDLGLGAGIKLGQKGLLRADMKYYYEKTQYLGYLLSYQVVY